MKTTIYIQAITENGSCVYATIKVNEDYTMNEFVNAVRSKGFSKFRIVDTMKAFANV